MLKEARIVMPHDSSPLACKVHAMLGNALIEAFGGHTRYAGNGGWYNGTETVSERIIIYDVAIDADSVNASDRLTRIALDAGRALSQDSVYVRYPSGDVEIIDLKIAHPAGAGTDASARDNLGPDLGAEAVAVIETEATREDALIEMLYEIFGRDNVSVLRTPKDADDFMSRGERVSIKEGGRKPQAGEVWRNRLGADVYVQREATGLGGWYVTIVDHNGTAHKVGFEYVVETNGKLYNEYLLGEHGISSFDLISFVR